MRVSRSGLGRWTLVAAAVSCGVEQGSHEQAHSAAMTDAATDAGDPQLAEYLRRKMQSDAIFCDPKLAVVCASDVLVNRCDFAATVAKECQLDPQVQVTKNKCGGVTFGSSGPFGGERWHYNDQHELVGVSLSADINQYCDKWSVQVGEDCVLTGEKLGICNDD